jgi:hypothetical protein
MGDGLAALHDSRLVPELSNIDQNPVQFTLNRVHTVNENVNGRQCE